MKRFILPIVFIAGIISLSTISFVNVKENNRLTEKLEQKENTTEQLKQENASLHDDVWNLNNQLMKEEKQ